MVADRESQPEFARWNRGIHRPARSWRSRAACALLTEASLIYTETSAVLLKRFTRIEKLFREPEIDVRAGYGPH